MQGREHVKHVRELVDGAIAALGEGRKDEGMSLWFRAAGYYMKYNELLLTPHNIINSQRMSRELLRAIDETGPR